MRLRQEHPTWGAPKIREKLRRLDLGISLPAISTVHAVLDRHGLVTRGRKARFRARGPGGLLVVQVLNYHRLRAQAIRALPVNFRRDEESGEE